MFPRIPLARSSLLVTPLAMLMAAPFAPVPVSAHSLDGYAVYRVPPAARPALLELHAMVYEMRMERDYVAELTPAQASRLAARGFEPVMLAPTVAEWEAGIREMPFFDSFHTYEQIRDGLYAAAAAHPSIARIRVLGSSVEGREITALEISDHVELDEDEPKLVWWGEIHGDEYAAGEMPYLYALYLCDQYGTDPDVTGFVDQNEIWCIPMINPDGRVHGQRTNMHGVDLNRDLGYQWTGEGFSPAPFSQPETRAVREFCMSVAACLSTAFHCYGDEVFYPWGYGPRDVPDVDVVTALGAGYATTAGYYLGNSFDDYPTHGELLDDAYGSHGDICYTIEVSYQAALLSQTFERNRLALNWLSARAGDALQGIRGRVTDAATGAPLRAAVWIAGNPIPCYSDPATGGVSRLVAPGTCDLLVWANGYQPATITNLVVAPGSPAHFDAALTRGAGEYAFAVTSVNQRNPCAGVLPCIDNLGNPQATYPSGALGPEDGVPASLGSAGFTVLDFGEGHEIEDGTGPDFSVVEAVGSFDLEAEAYAVYAGDAYVQDRQVGVAVGSASFDLAGTGLTSTRYLRIVDLSGSNPGLPYAGMDLDCVRVLHSVSSDVAQALGAGDADPIRISIAPNPIIRAAGARPSFHLDLASARRVTLAVYDARGRLVSRLLASELRDAGAYEVPLDTRLSPGLYLCSLASGDASATVKLVVLR